MLITGREGEREGKAISIHFFLIIYHKSFITEQRNVIRSPPLPKMPVSSMLEMPSLFSLVEIVFLFQAYSDDISFFKIF